MSGGFLLTFICVFNFDIRNMLKNHAFYVKIIYYMQAFVK